MNAIYFPMLFLSGSFFERDTFPEFLQAVADALPLTYFFDLVFGVVYEGDQIWDRPGDVAASRCGASQARSWRCAGFAGLRARVSFLQSGNPVGAMGSHEPALAFATRTLEPPALEIRVNFGMFAGREATAAEIDDLAAELLDKVTEVAIVAEERHEISAHSEAALHQVRIEVSGDKLPDDEHELDEMRGRLIEAADRWARECIAGRSVEIES